MATVTGYTSDNLDDLTGEMIVTGEVVGEDLILTKANGTPVNAGVVVGADGPSGGQIVPFSVGGVLSVQAYTLRLYINQALTITSVRASVGTAPTGASIVVDVLRNGVTLFTGGTDRPTIAAGTNTDVGTPAVTALSPGDYLTITVVSVGSTVAGSDLTVQVVT